MYEVTMLCQDGRVHIVAVVIIVVIIVTCVI